jgi:hypothetical protein
MTPGKGRQRQDGRDRAAGAGKPMMAETNKPGKMIQEKIARTTQPRHISWDRSYWTFQPGQDSQHKKLEQDSQDTSFITIHTANLVEFFSPCITCLIQQKYECKQAYFDRY